MLDDPENLNILRHPWLASAFHRQVIAEGVETVEHGLMLLQLGCELGQATDARPMPASDFRAGFGMEADPSWAKVPLVHSGNRAVQYASVAHVPGLPPLKRLLWKTSCSAFDESARMPI